MVFVFGSLPSLLTHLSLKLQKIRKSCFKSKIQTVNHLYRDSTSWQTIKSSTSLVQASALCSAAYNMGPLPELDESKLRLCRSILYLSLVKSSISSQIPVSQL